MIFNSLLLDFTNRRKYKNQYKYMKIIGVGPLPGLISYLHKQKVKNIKTKQKQRKTKAKKRK